MLKMNSIKTLTTGIVLALVSCPQAWACETGYVKGVKTGDCVPASGDCGTGCTYTLDGAGNLIVSGTGSIKSDAFKGNLDIVSAKINEGITGFGQSSFQNTSNMTSIDIADSANSFAYYVFQGSSVESLKLPKTTTGVDLSIIMYSPNIKEVILPKGMTWVGTNDISSGTSLVIPETVVGSDHPINSGKLYCTQSQKDTGICGATASVYERDENNNLVVYNKDGTIKGIYSDYTGITRDQVVESYEKTDENGNIFKYDGRGTLLASYKYDSGGNLIASYDRNGVATYRRTSYTPAEAAAAIKKGNVNKITLTFK